MIRFTIANRSCGRRFFSNQNRRPLSGFCFWSVELWPVVLVYGDGVSGPFFEWRTVDDEVYVYLWQEIPLFAIIVLIVILSDNAEEFIKCKNAA